MALLIVAGLQVIPVEVYEAAKMDRVVVAVPSPPPPPVMMAGRS
jgi:hypothetical protein